MSDFRWTMERMNHIRVRIPYAYWLFYDAVIAAAVVGDVRLGARWGLFVLPFLAVAVFFDVVEFVVKWNRDHWRSRAARKCLHMVHSEPGDFDRTYPCRHPVVAGTPFCALHQPEAEMKRR